MKKHQLLIVFAFCLATLSAKAQWKVLFSANGGFYDDVFELELFSTYPQGCIRYTVNGNHPTVQSKQYTEPLALDASFYSKSNIYTIVNCPQGVFYLPDSIQHCIVIRAAVFDENDSCVSAVTTNSYFFRTLGCDTHELPVISICADSLDLFDFEKGIMVPGIHFDSLNPNTTGNYFMKGREWERTINMEFYEVADNSGVNQICGLRAHGNRARKHHQKGMKVYAREEYGKKRFHHSFFDTSPEIPPIDSYKHLLIKPFSTLYPYSGIQDYVCSQMAIDLDLEAGHSRPVVVYLNGEYWGVYFLQEKLDERYLEDHFGIDIEQCNIICNWHELECGTSDPFMEMMAWLETTDLSEDENYRHIEDLVDLDNFIDYMVFETFIDNYDWPANNTRCWQAGDGKWRWMFYDGDAALGNLSMDPFGNTIPIDVFGNATYTGEYTWPSSEEATLLFRRLLDNTEFRIRFSNRLFELCHSHFLYENTSPLLTRIIDWLQPEIELQSFRFGNPSDANYWAWGCILADDFLMHRANTYMAEWENFVHSVPEYSNIAFSCYPNPFDESLNITLQCLISESLEATIYDVLGRKVYATPCACVSGANEFTLHPNLAPGVYLLNMGGQTLRIVKLYK